MEMRSLSGLPSRHLSGKKILLALLVAALAACTPAAGPGAKYPAKPASQDVIEDEPLASSTLREETLPSLAKLDRVPPTLPPMPKALPPVPTSCALYSARAIGPCPAGDPMVQLPGALSASDDVALAKLEACPGFTPGLLRALRAEMAPPACRDAIVEPLLSERRVPVPLLHALSGLAVEARFTRAALAPPKLAPPFDKERVLKFIAGPVAEWLTEQARLIEELSLFGVKLEGYGRAVAALEAGLTEMRLVEAIRAMPIPESMAKDPELVAVYEAALEEKLEPRKTRARDAALVGLREFAKLGILEDVRVVDARRGLSGMYAGRRIDALDALLLPTRPAVASDNARDHLAAKLPTYYVEFLFSAKDVEDAAWVQALAIRGVPTFVRAHLRGRPLAPETRLAYARARIDMGRTYWRAVDFDEAVRLLMGKDMDQPEARFYLALATALRGGPEDAAALMRSPPQHALRLGDVRPLETMAKERGNLAGFAAFDAAVVRFVSSAKKPDPAHWRDLAQRFRAAAALLPKGEQKVALDYATQADQVAAAQ